MTWVQIDDGMADHPKIMSLSHGAFRLQIEGLCFANRNLTDGHVPRLAAHRHGKRYAAELVAAGVWDAVDGGYMIHDYAEYQPSKAEVLERRAETAERVRNWRRNKRRNAASNSVTPANVTALVTGPPSPSLNHQTFLGQTSPTTSRPIDLEIKNGKTLNPGIQEAIMALIRELPDANDGTIGRLVKFAQNGAQQSDFHDARQGIAATQPRSPSSYACTTIANRIKARA
jgi:hypothetical protein